MNEYLTLISGNEHLALGPSDGSETIARSAGVFSYSDSAFKSYDVPGQATGELLLQVYEMAKDGSFPELFGGFGVHASCLSFTQAQITQFVKLHPRWLKQGGNGTFFLFRSSSEFVVAAVYLFSDGRTGVRARPFSLPRVFRARKRHRVVVPQLTVSPSLGGHPPQPVCSLDLKQ